MNYKITVIGLGYLGATTAIAFAKLGHEVIGIDPDSRKVAELQAGRIPFFEPGLAEALTEVQSSGRISFATGHSETSKDAQLHFMCVGTPQSKTTLSADTSYLYAAIDALAPVLAEDAIVVGKSTVPVGTADELRAHLAGLVDFEPHLAWNPEFLQEGKALADTLTPDRIVIGTDEVWSRRVLRDFYKPQVDGGIPLVEADIRTAELVKVAANSFLATKISFINAMAEIAETVGADAVKLAQPIGHDDRIGNKFLRTGIGFGGGCLPKDIRAFMARADELGLGQSVEFLQSVEAINLRRRSRVVDVAIEKLGDLTGKRVLMLGATFKPETDDIRDSPSLAVAELLAEAGAEVVVHDPMGLAHVEANYPQLSVEADLAAAFKDAQLVVLGTEWREYRELAPSELGAKPALIIDGRNCLDLEAWREAGWQTVALGRGNEPEWKAAIEVLPIVELENKALAS